MRRRADAERLAIHLDDHVLRERGHVEVDPRAVRLLHPPHREVAGQLRVAGDPRLERRVGHAVGEPLNQSERPVVDDAPPP